MQERDLSVNDVGYQSLHALVLGLSKVVPGDAGAHDELCGEAWRRRGDPHEVIALARGGRDELGRDVVGLGEDVGELGVDFRTGGLRDADLGPEL